jgi:hypothetical protein
MLQIQTKNFVRIQIVWEIQIQTQVFDDELGKNCRKKSNLL